MALTGRKVAIVGTADSYEGAPFDDDTWEIWGLARRGEKVTRATRWFEIHNLNTEGPEIARVTREAIRRMEDAFELWMFWPEKDLHDPVVHFRWEPLADIFGTYFMTSSAAWMMAQAIYEKVDEIGIWGIEAEFGTEYREQRSGIKHFIDLARFVGIKVHLVTIAGIAANPTPYPFWQDDPFQRRLRYEIDRNEGAVPKLTDAVLEAERNKAFADGKLEVLRWANDFLRP